jgi:hypothetical protein
LANDAIEVEPDAVPAEALREGWVPIGLDCRRTVQNPMRTSGSTFQWIRFRSENARRLNRCG